MLVGCCRHSRLTGSQDLERWALQAATAVRGAYQEHVLKPLLTVRDELFQTFRQVHFQASGIGTHRLLATKSFVI